MPGFGEFVRDQADARWFWPDIAAGAGELGPAQPLELLQRPDGLGTMGAVHHPGSRGARR